MESSSVSESKHGSMEQRSDSTDAFHSLPPVDLVASPSDGKTSDGMAGDCDFELTPSPQKDEGSGRRVDSRKRRTTDKVRPASAGARRVVHRPSPSPDWAPTIGAPARTAPAGESPEERLKTVEAQQELDHAYILQMGAVVKQLQHAVQGHEVKHHEALTERREFTQLGLQSRRDLSSWRENSMADLNNLKSQTDIGFKSVERHIEDRVTASIDAKIAMVQAAMEQLQTNVQRLNDKETKLETYIENLHGERPKEGAVVTQTFQQMNAEVMQVKALVQQFEARSLGVNAPSSSAPIYSAPQLSKEQLATLDAMRDKMGTVDQMQQSYNELCNRVNYIHTMTEAAHTNCASLSVRIDAHDAAALSKDTADFDDINLAHVCGGYGGGQQRGCPSGCPCPPGPASGVPASSAAGDPMHFLRSAIGGNNVCHCVHVAELIEDVRVIKAARGQGHPASDAPHDAWAQAAFGGRPGPSGPPGVPAQGGALPPRLAKKSLPLHLPGPLGALGRKDRAMFDDKLMTQEEYRYNGVKGGPQWKSKTERYWISKAPVFKEILEWAESEDMEVVTVERFKAAAGHRLTEEQILTANAEIWGWLSGVLTGTAETLFKRADILNGLDAWRRIVRQIDQGREIKLDGLRQEVKTLHMKPIKGVENVEEGIAAFENTILAYTQAGGTPLQDRELKSDLLAILPSEIREPLLWHATDGGSFENFRDTVLVQSAKVLNNRRRPLHAVNLERAEIPEAEENEDFGPINNIEELLAAVNRMRGKLSLWKGAGAQPRQQGSSAAATRGPRKCPNCGKEHVETKCPHPPVAMADRPCWTCNRKGHSSRDCPDKKSQGKPLKVIEDAMAAISIFSVDEEGFKPVVRGCRPRPKQATLADFVSKNNFESLASPGDSSRRIKTSACTPPSAGSPKVPPSQTLGGLSMIETVNQIDGMMKQAVDDAEATLSMLDHEDAGQLVAAALDEVHVTVAMDSAAVDNVVHPDDLPGGVEVKENTTGEHFVGAGGGRIKRFGSCRTLLKGSHGKVGSDWQVADVTRALHSVAKVTGTVDKPKQDVLFNAGTCVVVPPGIVDAILKKVKPIAEYPRNGNLYLANMTMSSFGRQGQDA